MTGEIDKCVTEAEENCMIVNVEINFCGSNLDNLTSSHFSAKLSLQKVAQVKLFLLLTANS